MRGKRHRLGWMPIWRNVSLWIVENGPCANLAGTRKPAGERRRNTCVVSPSSRLCTVGFRRRRVRRPVAAETITLRMAWTRTATRASDGRPAQAIPRAEQGHQIVLDQVPYKPINQNLPMQLASARARHGAHRRYGGLSRYALDMRPSLRTPPTGNQFRVWNGCGGSDQAIPAS